MTGSSLKPAAVCLAALLAVAAPAAAQSGSAKKGSGAKAGSGSKTAAGPIAVGATAPAVSLPGLGGESVDLGQAYAGGKTVLVMLRGYPGYQCPLCSRQVTEYSAKAAEFAAAGLRVVLVYPGEAGGLDARAGEFLGERTLPAPITMVLDPDYELTDTYGLRWDAPNETAYPSTFIIDGGVVTWATVSKTHGGRVTAADALAAATQP